MTIFDSDIFSDLVDEVPSVVARASAVPRDEQAIAIVTAGEVIRGQLNTVRQAEAGRGKVSLAEAYDFLLTAISLQKIAPQNGKAMVDLAMSQGELAMLVGASRPKVNIALTLLEEMGAISRSAAGYTSDTTILQDVAGVD